ncbi:MAG: EAL domain-containing protein [Methylophaga sp.]|nr:EAL domain-containing protein [Methylophaga sp.]
MRKKQLLTSKIIQYTSVVLLLLLLSVFSTRYDWHGSIELHTLMETIATILALTVGILSLIRYYGRSETQYLYIGAGFVGTAFLDGYHALVTSSFFLVYMPTQYADLVPWSWSASRFFLSFFILIHAAFVLRKAQQTESNVSPQNVYLVTFLMTLTFFLLFAWFPLPEISSKDNFVARPFELIPGLFFILSLIAHLMAGHWKTHNFDHWVVLFLIVSLMTQTAFMPFSHEVNDSAFNLAHLLKKASYCIVLIGLFISLYKSYQALSKELNNSRTLELALSEKAEMFEQSEKKFRAIADFTSGWELWHSPNGDVIYTNPACHEFTGYCEEDFTSGRLKVSDLLASGQSDEVLKHFKTIQPSDGIGDIEFLIEKKNGEQIWISQIFQSTFDEDGEFSGRRESNRDITEKKKQATLIWQQANIDPLTGLANRVQFQSALEREIERTQRNQTSLAVLMIDLDDFKHINDTEGHSFGDKVIVAVADRIKSSIRKFDVAGRFGGDEFNVIITQLTHQRTIDNICSKLLREIQQPIKINKKSIRLGCSIGVSLYPNDENDSEKLIRDADLAMYSAKHAGRGTYRFYSSELQENSTRRMSMHEDILDALENNYLELWYQPIIDLDSNKAKFAEALIRLNHPEKGYLPTAEFISVAEDTGAIIQLGDWVFARVIDDVSSYLEQLQFLEKIFINLSARQFHETNLQFEKFIEQAEVHRVKPGYFCMEITERVILEPNNFVSDNLAKLRQAGMNIAIDDFGTGYSSLAYIQRYDADFLKIDKTFINNITKSGRDLALVEAIVAMSKKLNISVVAEGVENAEQMNILRKAGCDFAQGYFIAKPMPLKQFMEFESLKTVG